jgi:hypothetical protein
MTALAVSFNVPLDPRSASNPGLYHVLALVRKHGKQAFARAVMIKQVTPDSDATVVTLKLARRLKGALELTVRGTITAASGASGMVDSTMIV